MKPITIVVLALIAIGILTLYASALVAIVTSPRTYLALELFLAAGATIGLAGATAIWGLAAVKSLEQNG